MNFWENDDYCYYLAQPKKRVLCVYKVYPIQFRIQNGVEQLRKLHTCRAVDKFVIKLRCVCMCAVCLSRVECVFSYQIGNVIAFILNIERSVFARVFSSNGLIEFDNLEFFIGQQKWIENKNRMLINDSISIWIWKWKKKTNSQNRKMAINETIAQHTRNYTRKQERVEKSNEKFSQTVHKILLNRLRNAHSAQINNRIELARRSKRKKIIIIVESSSTHTSHNRFVKMRRRCKFFSVFFDVIKLVLRVRGKSISLSLLRSVEPHFLAYFVSARYSDTFIFECLHWIG